MTEVKKIERRIFSLEEKQKILRKTACKCAHCGKKLNLKTMTIEHMYPLDKGGDNSNYNIIALCKKCNTEKSNFVYDCSWYPYIIDNELGRYETALVDKLYDNTTDRNIFGSAIKLIHALDIKIIERFSKSKSKEKDTILRGLARKLEYRQIYPGEVTDEFIDKINNMFYLQSSNIREKTVENTSIKANVNKLMILDLMRHATIYGLFDSSGITGIAVYMNIEELELSDTTFIDEIKRRGFKKCYVNVFSTLVSRDDGCLESVGRFEKLFMAATNNLVLMTEIDETKMFSAALNNHKISYIKLRKNSEFIKLENNTEFIRAIILDNKKYKLDMQEVEYIKENLAKYRKEIADLDLQIVE